METEILEGDVVQMLGFVNDPDTGLKCARKGSLAHVVALPEDEEWFTLFFERTGTVYDCHISQFKWLGRPQT